MTVNRVAMVLRSAWFLVLGGVAVGQASGQLPALAPTGSAPHGAASAPVIYTSQARPVQPREVLYTNGQLEINADNSSLRQLLDDIARKTGMKITGQVADEPVYGKYGPAPAADVLVSLLDGMDSNMLLTQTAAGIPAELVLTPRNGGPTPANSVDMTPAVPAPPRFSPANPAPATPSAMMPVPNRAAGGPGASAGGAPSPDGFMTDQQRAEHLQEIQAMQRKPWTPQQQ